MSLERRINKLEKKLAVRSDDPPRVIDVYFCGALPSEEEMRIAIEKSKELYPHSPWLIVHFLPYGFEHMIKPKPGTEVVWDYELGLCVYMGIVYKLTEKYDESRVKNRERDWESLLSEYTLGKPESQ